MRILGLDPGLAVTGFGLVEIDQRGTRLLDAGTFSTSTGRMAERLREIFRRTSELLERESPDEVALEEGFYGKNVKVALSLGQARGAILLACSLKNIPIFEYAPREVKQSVVGRGAASKEQVNYMVKALLNIKELPAALDVSDALAVAYCHFQRREQRL
ncbi:MAG: crossover junction endodeoxyribonuclease RuvC [candidate division Zixibacteria bacterium]|nr:crossover junction endodeoxyribonuclease RuvC [candidate division Zixibacteria bacterium]